jgi:hypothetical protein
MKTIYSHQKWVLFTPRKATEISNHLNEIRENGLMYAPNKIGKNKYATVEVFDEEGYSLGFLN